MRQAWPSARPGRQLLPWALLTTGILAHVAADDDDSVVDAIERELRIS